MGMNRDISKHMTFQTVIVHGTGEYSGLTLSYNIIYS